MRSRDIPRNVIEAIRKFVEGLEERGIRVEHVYLYGSYARGTWLKTSDVDLIIVSRDFEGDPIHQEA